MAIRPQAPAPGRRALGFKGWLQERQYETPYHWRQRPNDEREYQLRTDTVLDLAGLTASSLDPLRATGSETTGLTNTGGRAGLRGPGTKPERPTLLDIGCGDGRFTADAARVGRAVGTDVSRRALGHARVLVPDARFVASGGATLPFASNAFDVVTLLDVIEHVPDEDERRVVDEARRVLKPGGRLVISTNTDQSACELKHFRHYSIGRFRSLFDGLVRLRLIGLIPYFPTLRIWMATPLVSRFVESRIRTCSPEIAHVVVGAAVKP